ncbi:ribonuclease H-like domain-containing protein, partial [Tanacetum coccineum]
YPAGYVKRNSNSNSRPVTSNNASVDVHSNGVSSNNATTRNSLVSLSSDQLARLMNLLNENGVSTTNANMAASAKNLTNVVDVSNLGLTVGHPNGTQALITKIRDLKINNEVTLYDVSCGSPNTLSVLLSVSYRCQETTDLNHKKIDSENHKRPNDKGRVSSNDDGPELNPDINQGNDDSGATSMDETNNTHPEGTISDETDFINNFYENSKFNSETEEFPVHTLRSVEITCYEEAILDSNWVDAMDAEIEALNENHTWEITDLPPNRKAIGNKWIYKIKYKSSGDINRYKARIVVKCFNQKEGIDFDETFSLVVKMSTVRCVVALSVTNSCTYSNWMSIIPFYMET